MRKIKSFEDLDVWQNSIKLIEKAYKATANFPKEEKYNLVTQIRRASVSITSNIAEGFYRQTTKELINFIYMSRGSCGELICQLRISERLGYLEKSTASEIIEMIDHIGRQLNNWAKSLKRNINA